MRLGVLAAAFAAMCTWGASATATTIAPVGTTAVTVDQGFVDILVANSITASPIVPATAGAVPPPATFFFPITGGDLSTLTIDHAGGVLFDDGTNTLTAEDFQIRGGIPSVAARVNGAGGDPDGFPDIFDVSVVSFEDVTFTADLFINGTLSDAIIDTFLGGSPDEFNDDLQNTLFGRAVTSPQAVPLPASSLLLLAGVGGMMALRRRKAAS